MIEPDYVLKQHHQKAHQNQPKNKFFVNPGSYSGDNIS